MHAVTVRLQSDEPPSLDSARILAGAVQEAALPTDHLEHVFAQVNGAEVEMVMYFVATNLAGAETTATRLLERALSISSANWRTSTCQAELIVAIAEAALPPDK
jgi:hypothetical protein